MGRQSPAKILRSTKRITNFLRNKWKTDSPISIQPTQTQTKSHPMTLVEFIAIIENQKKERDEARAKEIEERKKDREKDLEKFKLMLGLPPEQNIK